MVLTPLLARLHGLVVKQYEAGWIVEVVDCPLEEMDVVGEKADRLVAA